MNKTITSRSKSFKDNASKVGWHVFYVADHIAPADQYKGYDDRSTLEELVGLATYCGHRLTGITGNGITFEK